MATDNVRIVFDDNLSELTKATVDYRNELVKNKKAQDDLYKAGKLGAKEYIAELSKIDDETNKLDRDTKKLSKDMSDGMANSGKGATMLSNTMGSLKGMIAGAFTVSSIVSFGKAIIDTTSEFQKFQSVLTNTFGDRGIADQMMATIQDFASKTPFSVAEVTGVFVKLANQGFVPTMQEMTKLGDLASSQGKTFDELAEALLDAQMGEFQRLKELNIGASKQGDNVAFSFKGVTTVVENSSTAIQKYILGLGELKGVMGGMEMQSKTLGGTISNIGDTWDKFLTKIGSSGGVLNTLATTISNSFSGLVDAIFPTDETIKMRSDNIQRVIRRAGADLDQITNADLAKKAKSNLEESIKIINSKIRVDEDRLKLLTKGSDEYLKLQEKINNKITGRQTLLNQIDAINKKTQSFEPKKLSDADAKKQNDLLKKQKDEAFKLEQGLAKAKNDILFERSERLINQINKDTETETNIVKQKYLNNEISAEEYYNAIKALEEQNLTSIATNTDIEIKERKKANQKILDNEVKAKSEFDKFFEDLVKEQDTAQSQEDAKKKKKRAKTKEEKEAEDRAYTDFAIESAEYTANQLLAIQDRKNQAELDKQMEQSEKLASNAQTALQNQLSEGVITQETFNKISEQIEVARLARQAKIKQDAWIKERNAQLLQIGINTAVGVSKVIAQTGILSPATIIPIIGLGALQAAFVLAQPVPKFAKGGYTGKGMGMIDETGHRQAGIVHDEEYVVPKEMVVSQKPLIEHLENIRTGKSTKKLVGDYSSIMVNDNTQVVKAIQRNKVVSLDDKTIKKLTQNARRTHLK